jgi:hypothetical protein
MADEEEEEEGEQEGDEDRALTAEELHRTYTAEELMQLTAQRRCVTC